MDQLELPHGAFALHSRDRVTGPDGEPALYVICSCGRGYSFGHYADSERLFAWLLDHSAEIPCPHRPSMQVNGKCADCGVSRDGESTIPDAPTDEPEIPAHLPTVIPGQEMPDDHGRMLEVYFREHGRPTPGTMITAAMVNRAVEWWNSREDESIPTEDA